MLNIRSDNINNLELYRVFNTVAEEGGFSRAAEKLFISQSAVSQSIRQLEERTGVKLFVRLPRGIRLTREGKMLLEHTGPALDKIRTGEKRIADMSTLETGSVTISSSDTFCTYLIPGLLKEFHIRYPGITMNIANMTSSETRRLLDRGEADIGIINLYGDNDKGLRIWKEYAIHDCFIIRKGALADGTGVISSTDLASFKHIMLERGTSTRAHIDSYFKSSGTTVEPIIEVGSVELLLKFAAMGMGISCIAREFLEKSPYSGEVEIIQAEKPVNERSIGVVTLKGIPLSKAAEAFLGLITEEG